MGTTPTLRDRLPPRDAPHTDSALKSAIETGTVIHTTQDLQCVRTCYNTNQCNEPLYEPHYEFTMRPECPVEKSPPAVTRCVGVEPAWLRIGSVRACYEMKPARKSLVQLC